MIWDSAANTKRHQLVFSHTSLFIRISSGYVVLYRIYQTFYIVRAVELGEAVEVRG